MILAAWPATTTYLPLVQLLLFGLVLLYEILEDLFQPLGVGCQRRQHFLNGLLHQDSVD